MDRLWAIEVFVRVAESGSFSRAAESLDVSNATVTGVIRNLERHLNLRLIDRDTRRLRLTEEGETYFLRVRDLLEGLTRAEEELQQQTSELRGRLHVETTISLGDALLCPVLPKFAELYPEVTTVVTLINQPQNMIERGIDVALRLGHVEDADLVARPVCDMSYVLCCAPAQAGALPALPADLDPALCFGHFANDRRTIKPWHLHRGSEQIEIHPNGPLHLNSSSHLLEVLKAGKGVGCILDALAQRHFTEGRLVRAYPEWTGITKTLYLATSKSRVGSAKVKAFGDLFAAAVQHLQPPEPHRMVGIKEPGRR
jgi:LysR family transcriptional regulator for bpeEF and oprC